MNSVSCPTAWQKPKTRLQVAAGHLAIRLPVVYLGDNHGSRFDPDVLQMTDPDDHKFCGILLDFEESNTSQMLQMWDQINKAAHASYNKGKAEYKKQYKSRCAAARRPLVSCHCSCCVQA